MRKEKISSAVIRRLPRYYRFVDNLYYDGVTRISSQALGKALGFTASQIRQDLSRFGEFGQQGYGYSVEKLRNEIAGILGMYRGHKCIIVGAGNLGRALIRNFTFDKYGFTLVAAFDLDPEMLGTEIQGVPVYHVGELEEWVARIRPDVAVLTTPRSVASRTANRLVAAGVQGIWNFTNIELKLDHPENVIVENVHFADSLLSLSYYIAEDERPDQRDPEETD
jgi:redox-sensing transcriptional repressor